MPVVWKRYSIDTDIRLTRSNIPICGRYRNTAGGQFLPRETGGRNNIFHHSAVFRSGDQGVAGQPIHCILLPAFVFIGCRGKMHSPARILVLRFAFCRFYTVIGIEIAHLVECQTLGHNGKIADSILSKIGGRSFLGVNFLC